MGSGNSTQRTETINDILNESLLTVVNKNKSTVSASVLLDQSVVNLGDIGNGAHISIGETNQNANAKIDLKGTISTLSNINLKDEIKAAIDAQIDAKAKVDTSILPFGPETEQTTITKNTVRNIIDTKVTDINMSECMSSIKLSQNVVTAGNVGDDLVLTIGKTTQKADTQLIANCIINSEKKMEIARAIDTEVSAKVKASLEKRGLISQVFDGLTNMFGALLLPMLAAIVGIIIVLVVYMNSGGSEEYGQQYGQQYGYGPSKSKPIKYLKKMYKRMMKALKVT
jgi:hypothetical protein